MLLPWWQRTKSRLQVCHFVEVKSNGLHHKGVDITGCHFGEPWCRNFSWLAASWGGRSVTKRNVKIFAVLPSLEEQNNGRLAADLPFIYVLSVAPLIRTFYFKLVRKELKYRTSLFWREPCRNYAVRVKVTVMRFLSGLMDSPEAMTSVEWLLVREQRKNNNRTGNKR
jgi:hypothetical protein